MAPSAPMPDKKERCNIANAKELKHYCDDTIEQLLTQSREADSVDGKDKYFVDFKPFRASHVMDNIIMLLNFVGSFAMLSSTAYIYFKKIEWNDSKPVLYVSVTTFFVLFAISSLILYIRGPVVFTGVRTSNAHHNELECIVIRSPHMHKANVSGEKTKEGRDVLVPPMYELDIDYMRLGSDGRTVCARKRGGVIVGNFGTYIILKQGEWFTQEGEFVRSAFDAHLMSSLLKHISA